MKSTPGKWVGLGFVATIENAPASTLAGIEGITAVAAQIAWGLDRQKPELMPGYLASLETAGLVPVGWAWCNADDVAGARQEGARHADIALGLGLELFIANMEEVYDAHSDTASPRFHMPDAYLEAFRDLAPELELAVTTTPRWASNHEAVRAAGAVHMPQAFSLEVPSPPGPATVAACVAFSEAWGWQARYVRPLVQVYETKGEVPASGPYLEESKAAGVGVVPYILEQALGGAGRQLLAELVPAITRQPAPEGGGDDMELIGKQHGITASVNRLRTLDPAGTLLEPDAAGKWPPLSTLTEPVDKWRAYDKLERTLGILARDHDAVVANSSGATFATEPAGKTPA